MPFFVAEAKRLVAHPDTSDVLRATLKYMLRHCVGSQNAAPIGKVLEHLERQGFNISRESFQHQILVRSRKSNLYIASGKQGIYLIQSKADAQLMMEFYRDRIESEQHHLNRLTELRDAKFQ